MREEAIARRDVVFESPERLELVGTVHEPPGEPLAGVVVCHGMLSSRSSPKHVELSDALARLGLLALRFDFSGRGESEGRLEDLSYHRQLGELGVAASWLGARAGAVAVVGSSMGGAVALLHAARAPDLLCVVGLAAVGRPAELLARLGGEALARWERDGRLVRDDGLAFGRALLESAREVDVPGAAAALRSPLLLVHGRQDEVVPLEQAEELHLRAARSRLEVLEGADHVFSRPRDRARLVELVCRFVHGEARRRAEAS